MLKKTIYTLVAICLSIVVWQFYDFDKNIGTGEIEVEIVKGDYVVSDTFSFAEDENFVEIISSKYEVVIENGYLYKIDFLEAYDSNQYYIEIYINCEPSSVGINLIQLNDGDKISFIYKQIGDYSNVCN